MISEREIRKRKTPKIVEASKNTQLVSEPKLQHDNSYLSHILPSSMIIPLLIAAFLYFFPEHYVTVRIYSFLDFFLNSLGISKILYAVVLDAGSTGSRVLVFSFLSSPFNEHLVLLKEHFHSVKPGLSSFASNPEAGADSISNLLAIAEETIPKEKWSSVPVTLKATAGLRMLPYEQSEALISAVQKRLDSSSFDNRGVGMLSELDEGVFGWMTVNYLMEQLKIPRKSYVALDLGGGSTQITFLPKYEETFASTPQSYLHPIKIFSANHTIYSHSYLGLGLMAAREAIFRNDDQLENTVLESPCMVSQSSIPWEFHGKNYTIFPSKKLRGYEACMMKVQSVIDNLNVDQCEEVPTRKIAAFSYFHDRAVDAGILKSGESGVVTVQQFLDSAQKACDKLPETEEEAFLCVDLSFIAGLLHHGYRLAAQAKLGLYKQINGYQTSWALGAAFDMLG